MARKLKKTSEELANKSFAFKPNGYDPLEVDTILDEIIKDYELIESSVVLSTDEYQNLKNEIDNLKKVNIDRAIELENEKSKWKNLTSNNQEVHIDNLELLQRIGKLEKIIYDNLHLSPEEIYSFDPDDC